MVDDIADITDTVVENVEWLANAPLRVGLIIISMVLVAALWIVWKAYRQERADHLATNRKIQDLLTARIEAQEREAVARERLGSLMERLVLAKAADK